MVNKNKRAKTQAPAKADRPPLWNHRLFPPVFFFALSLLYFYEFPLSDKIVYGTVSYTHLTLPTNREV